MNPAEEKLRDLIHAVINEVESDEDVFISSYSIKRVLLEIYMEY